MSVWAGAAQAAMQIADKFIDSRRGEGGGQDRQFAADMYYRQEQDRKAALREDPLRVMQGAKAAGVHPSLLFAGGGSGSQRNITLPGATGRRTGGGAGLGAAAGSIIRSTRQGQIDALTRERHAIDMERQKVALRQDNIELMAAESDFARRNQELNAGPKVTEDGTVVVPPPTSTAGTRPKELGALRHTQVAPQINAPMDMDYIDREGKVASAYHPALQADELNQVRIAKKELEDWWRAEKVRIARKHSRTKGTGRGGTTYSGDIRRLSKKYAELRRQIREEYYQPIAARRPGRRGSGKIKPRRRNRT